MRNIAMLPFMLVFLIVGCHKTSTAIERELYKLSYGRYEIAGGGMVDRYYTDYKGNTITMPLLPCGLFLYFSDNEELPILDYQKRIEDVGFYPMHNVQKVMIYQKGLVVLNDADKIYEISLMNPWDYTEKENISDSDKEHSIKEYHFINNGKKYKNIYAHTFGLQDNDKNKKYKVSYSTPIINGITKIGLCSHRYLVGETIYSFFAFDIKNQEITYFFDEEEYKDFCYKNIYSTGFEMLISLYCYKNGKSIIK
ncbi:hypothetical protein ABH09_01175 [Treponema sp. OMZ 803]|uniref:hypothetical protein n=1 Tax=Treponema sp. OMZ 803 TaxID=120682 RepID=UPI0020A2D408|nr:hypothetical protein [Treponema sp. OMZ 803]UTC53323.1 hypothetical protein ABH09_01175 [Treponema sp. OMZ 803]